ncbi:hypothetical protein ACWDR0_29350 [Streptomyces sp. NPDC003691]
MILLFLAVGFTGTALSDDPRTVTKPVPGPTVTVTVTATPRAEAPAAAGTEEPVPAATRTAAPVARTEAGTDPAASSAGRLPNLVGQQLQAAQDAAQAAGFHRLDSHDATGEGRMQVLDRNWKVCSQTPAPGRADPSGTVDFGAVKIEESCP